MIQYYFLLQFKLLSRRMTAFGLHPILGIICLPILFIIFSWLFFQKIIFSEYVYSFIPVYMLIMNNNSTYKSRFMKSYFSGKQNLIIRLLENLLISISFVLFLLFQEAYIIAILLLALSIMLAIWNPTKRHQTKIPTPFSKRPFEFTIGFRKSIVFILTTYILLIVSIQVNNFNLGVVILGFLFLIPLSYYVHVEPKYYVQIFSDNPSQFLVNKIRTAFIYTLLLTLPFSVILAIFFPSYYLFILILNIVGVLIISLSIIVKYSSYPKPMSMADSIVLAISIVIPPLLFITIPRLYKKSVEHLTPVLG